MALRSMSDGNNTVIRMHTHVNHKKYVPNSYCSISSLTPCSIHCSSNCRSIQDHERHVDMLEICRMVTYHFIDAKCVSQQYISICYASIIKCHVLYVNMSCNNITMSML